MYYGNGFTHSDVYNMPTYLRKFYSNKLIDQLKNEQKEAEKAHKKSSTIPKPNFNPKFKR